MRSGYRLLWLGLFALAACGAQMDPAPSCDDGVLNGQETDIDCGGGACLPCPAQLACLAPGDCSSKICQGGVCQQPTCRDNVKNGQETDVDCGGPCRPCGSGKTCRAPTDCEGGTCQDRICSCVSSACGPGLVCDGSCVEPRSCLHLLSERPGTQDGVYRIDLDGPGGTAPIPVYCDMRVDGGGWTRVVNIRGDSALHANRVEAVGDVSNPDTAAKLSDEVINLLNTVGYFRYGCGTATMFVRNQENTWTARSNNSLNWQIDRQRDGTFECAASRPGFGFSDYPACPQGHTNYTDGSARGCYLDGVGWSRNGSLWVK